DPVLRGKFFYDRENRRQEVEVLVTVQVRDPQTGGDHALDLHAQLALDIDPFSAEYEADVILRHRLAGRQRALLDQRQVHADFERGRGAEAVHRVVERGPVRDDAAGRDDAVAMGADGSFGHAAM